MATAKRAAIAGAGLMGRMIGWRLADLGWDVTLHERASAARPRSAAHVAAAMLAPTSELPETDPSIHALGRRSLDAWPPMLDALGVPYGMDGSLLVAHGPDAPLLGKFHRSLGCRAATEARWLDGAGVAELEPALAGRFERGLYLPNEGWLDNRALLDALAARCGRILFDAPADPMRLRADLVIDCRGTAAALPGLRGVRGEAIRVHAPEVALRRPVRLMHPRYQLYIAPRPGRRYVVGATQIESQSEQPVTVRSALELLSAAFAVHPGFAEAAVEELGVGLRPAFPDNLPRVEWQGGVLTVNGLYRHGFLVAPEIVRMVEAMVFEARERNGAPAIPGAAPRQAATASGR